MRSNRHGSQSSFPYQPLPPVKQKSGWTSAGQWVRISKIKAKCPGYVTVTSYSTKMKSLLGGSAPALDIVIKIILETIPLHASPPLESETCQCPLGTVRSMEENFPVLHFFSWNSLLALWNPAEPQDILPCGFKFCCWNNHCAFSATS